jgi:pilus assembly protein CpaF
MLWRREQKSNKRKKESTLDRIHGDLDEVVGTVDADSPYAPELNGAAAIPSEKREFDEAFEHDGGGISPERETLISSLKNQVHREVVEKIDLSAIGMLNEDDLRAEIRRNAELVLDERSADLTPAERELLINDVIDETFGLGPLEPLFHDDQVTDIMINGSRKVYVEKAGRLELSKIKFANDAHVVKIVQRIVGAIGRRIDETSPMVDGRLKDGSRINAIIPPLALDGPLVSIRRFGTRPLQAENLINNQSITPEILDFVRNCVAGRLNCLISGGTGSGKTTLLNILSASIPDSERVATIEDAAELQLQQSHVIRMETRPPNIEGEGEVTTRDLVRNALRMRPDRIIVGECRGAEALDMLQAMNTGHDGSLTTVHANTPRDALMRLEMMVGMSGLEIPIWTIRRQIASAINIVIQTTRLTGGPRKVLAVSEITGMEGEIISMHDLFRFHQTHVNEKGVACGYFEATGVRPRCLDRLEACGRGMDPRLFEKRQLSGPVQDEKRK